MPRGPALAVKPVQIETFVGSVEPVFSQRARFGRLASSEENRESRYVSDLKRFGYGQSLFFGLRKTIVPLGLSVVFLAVVGTRSEERTSELQSLMRISYAVFCLKKKTTRHTTTPPTHLTAPIHPAPR